MTLHLIHSNYFLSKAKAGGRHEWFDESEFYFDDETSDVLVKVYESYQKYDDGRIEETKNFIEEKRIPVSALPKDAQNAFKAKFPNV